MRSSFQQRQEFLACVVQTTCYSSVAEKKTTFSHMTFADYLIPYSRFSSLGQQPLTSLARMVTKGTTSMLTKNPKL